jgi:rhodanese-related sulfurtransferase
MLNLFKRAPKGYVDVSPDDVRALMAEDIRFQLVDVRNRSEFSRGHLKGAKLIPLPELAARSKQLDASRPIVVYCATGHRSKHAARTLVEQGFGDVRHLEGGIARWGDDVVR